jgi:hypothetical protein
MLALAIFSLITAVRLPSVKISPLLLTRVTSIILLYAGVLSFNCMYIQAIGSGIGIYSGLFQVTPVSEFIDAFIVVIGAIILIGWAPLGSLFLTKHRSLVRLECKSLYKKISSRIQVRIQLLCIWEFYVYLLVRRLVYSRLLRTILIWLYIFLCVILLIFGLIKCLIENGLSLGELSFSFNSNLIYIDIGGVKFITPSTSILEFNKPFFIHLINNTNIITDTIATSESYTIPASYNAWKTRPIGFDANFHIAKNFASIRSTPFDVDSVLVNLADTCKISFSTFNLIPHIGHLHVYLYEGGPASVLALVALKDPELGLVRIVVL